MCKTTNKIAAFINCDNIKAMLTTHYPRPEDICRTCDGVTECGPSAILLMTLLHALYGHLNHEPDYLTADQPSASKNRSSESYPDPGKTEVYDFVVIGAGTAGSVVASRLSENKNWKVLVIEAGGEQPKLTLIPALATDFIGSSLDWHFFARPNKGFCKNKGAFGCPMPQGKVMGGTSSINNMVYVRGSQHDYNAWAHEGNFGWSFSDVLPFFKYSEGNYDSTISKNKLYHSTDGPLDIGRYNRHYDEVSDILLEALLEKGFTGIDVNANSQLGCMRVQTMSNFGERVSTNNAFLDPIRQLRQNIVIITEALATKILFMSKGDYVRAVGVEYIKNGEIRRVKIKKEIIVSAGVINSPKLLMQSGIGPKDYLEFIDIQVKSVLDVGKNLHDHVSVCLPAIKLPEKATTKVDFETKLKHITMYYENRTGPLALNSEVFAFLETNYSEVGAPDIQIHFKGYGSSMYYDLMEICVSLLTPKSRGEIFLNSTHPTFGKPLIYPHYFQNPLDEKILIEGIKTIMHIFETDVFEQADFRLAVKVLGSSCRHRPFLSDSYWSCFIRLYTTNMHNYVGTCKMGSPKDLSAVVDPELRVYGTSRLRIADASIIPTITRGGTAAATVMIAEKVSNMIRKTWHQKNGIT